MTKRLALLILLLPAVARAQAPAGSEFQINTYTTGAQDVSALATAPDGRFLVVWRTLRDSHDIGAQLYDARGNRLGGEFLVNAETTGVQQLAGVAAVRGDGFVVAFGTPDGDGSGVHARRLDRDGVPLGSEFQVNTVTTGNQIARDVAAAADGSFLVAWDKADGTGGVNAFARRYGADGSARGDEFRVNATSAGAHGDAAVAGTPGNGFLVTWTALIAPGPSGILARRFAADGSPTTGDISISSTGDRSSTVAVDATGGFVVAWAAPDGSGSGIMARRFDAAGTPRGAAFLVNTSTIGDQFEPAMAGSADGGFTIGWAEPFGGDVFARRYGRSGLPRGPVIRLNTYTTDLQYLVSLTSDLSGNLVAAWSSDGQDGSTLGIFGQRYGGLRPAGLQVDTALGPKSDGNSVLEACETVTVAPAWRNDTGSPQAFTAAAGVIGGPAGATYAIADAGADYGIVADDEEATCADSGDCFAVSVACASPRPAPHWDAFLVEEIVPEEQGQTQRWALHLGDSFTDVPRSSPFYRFVETLLHRGVTGGCDATHYCPLSPTTREQMPVFLLLALEHAGYAPPACGIPVFADVPASSAFCPWIEELARRGVISGCGGGNYCPAAAVTREQMAVFVLRTLAPGFTPPACTTPTLFADVPAVSPFCRYIEELVRRGVVSGCGGGNYCPTADVTREQAGVFLTTAFGLTLYGP